MLKIFQNSLFDFLKFLFGGSRRSPLSGTSSYLSIYRIIYCDIRIFFSSYLDFTRFQIAE